MAKYLDANGVLYLWTKITGLTSTLDSKKVDKVSGKDLSTNDLTNDLKTKYDAAYTHSLAAHAPSNAEKNLINVIKVNGVAQTITSFTVDLVVPTKTSQITNDSSFAVDASYNHTDNNYTTDEKNKLIGIAAGAEVNVITGISINGVSQTPTNKVVNIAVPTKLSQITNDGNYVVDKNYVHTDSNFTAAEKTKLAGLDSTSNANIIEEIRVNDVALVPNASKSVNVIIPTKTSDITNDSNYVVDESYNHTDFNFTSAYKTKIDGIAAGAEVNVITAIKVNGTAQTITSKAVNISVPTKTSQITNDSNFPIDASYIHTDNNYSNEEKSKLSGVATGAEVNVITGITVNGATVTPVSRIVALTVPTKVSQLTNDSGYLTSHQDISGLAEKATTLAGYGITDAYTKTQVDGLISSTYTPAGSTTFASLPTPSASILGHVYNVTDAFTTDSRFLEGAGKAYGVNSNVAVINNSGTYMFDVLQGFVDLSGYVPIDSALSNAEIDTIIASVS